MEHPRKSPLLIVFAGLPGTGKTTLAKAIARKLSATYLRIDVIEQALRSVGSRAADDGAGYVIGYALAESNLLVGGVVVADSVNRIAMTRDAWRQVAVKTLSRIVEVETICSNETEHKRRVETRTGDITGLPLPTWQQVADRKSEAWDRAHVVIDTAINTEEAALHELLRQIPTA